MGKYLVKTVQDVLDGEQFLDGGASICFLPCRRSTPYDRAQFFGDVASVALIAGIGELDLEPVDAVDVVCPKGDFVAHFGGESCAGVPRKTTVHEAVHFLVMNLVRGLIPGSMETIWPAIFGIFLAVVSLSEDSFVANWRSLLILRSGTANLNVPMSLQKRNLSRVSDR